MISRHLKLNMSQTKFTPPEHPFLLRPPLSQLMTTPFYQLPLSHLRLQSFSHISYPSPQHIYWLYLKNTSRFWWFLTTATMDTALVQATIRSYTDCFNSISTGLKTIKADQISHSCAPAILHAAGRVILLKYRLDHVNPLLKVLQWLPPYYEQKF